VKQESSPQKSKHSSKQDHPEGKVVNSDEHRRDNERSNPQTGQNMSQHAEQKPPPQAAESMVRDTDKPRTNQQEFGQPIKHLLQRFFNWMLLLIVLTAIGFTAMFLWLPRMPEIVQVWIQEFIELPLAQMPQNLSVMLKNLDTEIADYQLNQKALVSRVDVLEASAAALSAPNTVLTNELEQRLVALENQSYSMADGDINTEGPSAPTISALNQRLEAMEQTTKNLVTKQTGSLALVMAGLRLRQAIELGQPFETELRVAETLAAQMNIPSLDTAEFKSYTATGLPTRATLVQQFNRLTGTMIRADINPADSGSLRSALDSLLSIVTVSRVDVKENDDSTPAITTRASLHLEAGDLHIAVSELEQLSDPPREIVKGWLKHATARLAAERSATAFTSRAIVRVNLTDRPSNSNPSMAIQND